ncbi:hypothetical protein Tco_0838189 [Tanacetum coccineum]|uniref:Uncharacterized protein n=1 Tax=Tanacetum coccineum TaxID=301880 RepID=A0ABQ5AQ11_9ASTR
MDNSNWRPTQGVSGGPVGDASMESGDWRAQLQADSRQRIVNKIVYGRKRWIAVDGTDMWLGCHGFSNALSRHRSVKRFLLLLLLLLWSDSHFVIK